MIYPYLQNTPFEALRRIADFVKTARLNQEMTHAELAERSGVSRSSLFRLEKHGECSTAMLVNVLAALGVLDDLVTALQLPEKALSIAELRKSVSQKPRQRGRRRRDEA